MQEQRVRKSLKIAAPFAPVFLILSGLHKSHHTDYFSKDFKSFFYDDGIHLIIFGLQSVISVLSL